MAVGCEAAETSSLVVEHRVRSALAVAGLYRTGIPIAELAALLPEGAPHGQALVDWLRSHPAVGRVDEGVAFHPEGFPGSVRGARRLRGEFYIENARALVAGDLAPARSLLRCLLVTGSAAYGEPEEGDDCDLMLVTRKGGLWTALAYLFLVFRVRRLRGGDRTSWCLNYAMDELQARAEFDRPRGFLFAREALTSRPVLGERYYLSLLGQATWMREEAPRLYARWATSGFPVPPSASSAPRAMRLLDSILYPLVGAYLQAKALFANWQLRRQGRAEESFRTVTQPRKLALVTTKYDRLNELYRPATIVGAEPSGIA